MVHCAAPAVPVVRPVAVAASRPPGYPFSRDLDADIPEEIARRPGRPGRTPANTLGNTDIGLSRWSRRLALRQIANLTEETMSAPAANSVSWFEIGAPDVNAAKAFYGPLFGWSFAPDGSYTLITAPGAERPSGGIFNTGGNIPPYAVFVVQVDDVAATAARSEELGGKIVVAPMTLEDGMAVAYLTDPHGAMFALFSPRSGS